MMLIALVSAFAVAAPSGQTAPRPSSDLTRSLNGGPAAQSAAPAPAPTRPAAPPAAVTTPAPVATTAAAPRAPEVAPLSAAAIAALPFRATVPAGFQMIQRPSGADAKVYAIQRGGQTFVTVYAGPASQFPIYDGEMVQAGGRSSVVLTENGQRTAAEHLFQRPSAPKEIHVWIASLDGADRVQAEAIGQGVEPR
ncbi:hypothetical protein [Brevundimonas sp. PAMC22021]|uniref:hypothetical protein n=1 Tax=Brevundimonas sp. PAMC22021 TaxID=2861285 RepID=UPI001C637101|nr:hypothetical protein [Brevundimonas sp. PAMC22021]QYF87642.1 hypothetical protein KY493_03835 [Brevundimonas sp. PAMC22021]